MRTHHHIWQPASVLVVLCLVFTLFQIGSASGAAALSQTADPKEDTIVKGAFNAVWSDMPTGSRAEKEDGGQLVLLLQAEDGMSIELVIEDKLLERQGGVLFLNGEPVEVAGKWLVEPALDVRVPVLAVNKIKLLKDKDKPKDPKKPPQALTGNVPWVSVMCKFPDVTTEPKTKTFFQGMYAASYPGLDHYWRAVSYDKVNLSGSGAFGWFTLPNPSSYYLHDTNNDGEFDLDTTSAFIDCTAAADPYVNFAPYMGINLMFNENTGCCAYGGSRTATLDGVSKTWRVTWEPPWAYQDISVIEHEMGHGFGMPHSSDDYGAVYNNIWDVVSTAKFNCAFNSDPIYGCVGQGTISFNKNLDGWLAPSQITSVAMGQQKTVTLDHLFLPNAVKNLVLIPINDSSTHYYTVEVRSLVSYDVKLPGKAVVIHEVDTTRGEPAHVMDNDGNQNTGDAGAMWVAGETFHGKSGITIQVTAETSLGFMVEVNNPLENSDLIVESIGVSPTVALSGQPVQFTVRVKNAGTADASSRFWVDFYVDDAPAGCSDFSGTAYWSVNGLSVGAVQEFTYTHPGFDQPSMHTVSAFVDSGCDINEWDEGNNVNTAQVNIVAGWPDLVVDSYWLEPANPVAGSFYEITFRVKNQGLFDMTDTSDFVLATDPISECGDNSGWLISGGIQPLPAGGTEEWTTYVGDLYNSPGTYTIYAYVDSQCHQTETNENNNAMNITFTLGGNDVIFADGFESGNPYSWTSGVSDGGDLKVTTSAAYAGTYGMQALIDDNTAIYATDDKPAAEKRYRARFYYNPASLTQTSGDTHIIFMGYSGSYNVFLVEMRYTSGTYNIHVGVRDNASTWKYSSYYPISKAWHAIEIDWRAATSVGANNGGLTLWIDGLQKADLTGVNNDLRAIDRVRLGAVSSIDTGTRGTEYFDAFESRRQTYIGP